MTLLKWKDLEVLEITRKKINPVEMGTSRNHHSGSEKLNVIRVSFSVLSGLAQEHSLHSSSAFLDPATPAKPPLLCSVIAVTT